MTTLWNYMVGADAPQGSRGTEDALLPLTHVDIQVCAVAGIARVECVQRFRNDSDLPLRVTYSLPLPADAAVSSFEFQVGERRIVGEVDRREAARERFEEALIEGKTAALLEQERSSLFTQELGNIPPRAEIVAKVTLDQPLPWTLDAGWEWRFPTTVLPRFLGEPERVADASRVAQVMLEGPGSPRATLCFETSDVGVGRRLSASHPVNVREHGSGLRCELAENSGVPLDRDLVVRFRPEAPAVGARLSAGEFRSRGDGVEECFGLLQLVPPERALPSVARDAIVLLDTSGSMSGQPLDQARRVVLAFLDTLRDGDSLELIEFSNAARRWRKSAAPATRENLADARKWLAALRADGGTEMTSALEEALTPLRADAQRQVVLVTDGAIGFEQEVLAMLCTKLPVGSRLHTVGVGSAVNRSLTQPAARAGRGVEVLVSLDDDVERAAKRLVARTEAPALVDLTLEGDALVEHAPARLPDLFRAAPVGLAVKLKREGKVRVRGRLATGEWWQDEVEVGTLDDATGRVAATLFARERIEDLELDVAAGADASKNEARIEAVALAFQIASRKTSWVAVNEEPGVDPGAPTRRVRMPHALPHGVSVEGLGLRAPGMLRSRGMLRLSFGSAPARGRAPAPRAPAAAAPPAQARSSSSAPPSKLDRVAEFFGLKRDRSTPPQSSPEQHTWGEPAAATRELVGKLTLRKQRAIVVEVELGDFEFTFELPSKVKLGYKDGTMLDAEFVAAKSTRPGPLSRGSTLRLWLATEVDLPSAPLLWVRVEHPDFELVVRIEP
jgi:Ca-activated chloride channel family protein